MLRCAPFNLNFGEAPSNPEALRDPIETGWTLRFSDDFERTEIGADWKSIAGNWKIVNGALVANHPEKRSGKLYITRDFPGAQRLEYDASTDEPGDLSAVLGADDIGRWETGYFFGFGSNWNLSSKLLVRGPEKAIYFAPVIAGKVHRVVCQRDGDLLTHIADGKVVMTYRDPKPLTGEGHQRISLYTFGGTSKIDHVKVYRKPE